MTILQQDQFDQIVLDLVNQYRAQNGILALTLSQELDQAADKYAARMATGDFFSHNDPNGSTPFTRMLAEGYNYTWAGENIAAGYLTPQQVVQGWIDSPGHRANILNANFTHMGLGYVYLANDTGTTNYNRYWVQKFGAGDPNPGTYVAETDSGNLNINGTAGNDILNGAANNETLNGYAGNDTLNGGAGVDTLIGGLGNDIYVVDSTNDTIIEFSGQGTDTIQSSVTFSIAALTNIENLTLTGTAAINATGNAGNNVIIGNNGNNALAGGAGNDRLTGGTGKDTLTGGLGVDRFDYRKLADSVFNNFDIITDFNATAGNDLFLVATARSGFNNVGTVATLNTSGIAAKLTTANFAANSAAQFTFGSRTFVAINNATAGFSATADAIIEVTGLTGTLGLSNFTTTLV
jgi:Ca2+-binding RTX toxin-like protein